MSTPKKTRRTRGAGSVERRSDGRAYARWQKDGSPVRVPFATEDEAQEFLGAVAVLRRREGLSLLPAIARLSPSPERPSGGATFLHLLDLYLDWCEQQGHLKANTLKTNRQRAGVLRAAPWAGMALEQLTRRDVRAWVTKRMSKGVSGKTVTNDLVLASSAFAFADDEGLIDEDAVNPFLRARPKRYKKRERRALEPNAYLALGEAVRAVTPALWPMFLGSHFSGWRGGELCELRWADVHLDDDPRLEIDAAREKTSKDKVARIFDPMVSMLQDQRRARPSLPSAYLFTDERGRPWTRKTRINRFRKALATVPLEIIPASHRERTDTHLPLDWHSLRHTWRNVAESRGHRPVTIGETMGQSDPATARRYSHSYQEESRELARDLGAFLAGETKATGEA